MKQIVKQYKQNNKYQKKEDKLNRQILHDMFNYNIHTERELKELHNSKKDLIHKIKNNNKERRDLEKQIKELNKVIKQLHNVDNNQLKKELRKNRRLNKIKDELLKKQEELINKQRESDDIILNILLQIRIKNLKLLKEI